MVLIGCRYHISMGYNTVTALLTIFKRINNEATFNFNSCYEYVEKIDEEYNPGTTVFGVLHFDQFATAIPNSVIVGSDLQTETVNSCRIAFSGVLLDYNSSKKSPTEYLSAIKIYKEKYKQGFVDRILSDNAVIAKGFCKKESKIDHLIGLKVSLKIPDNEFNVPAFISSRFGQTNKVRIDLNSSLSPEQKEVFKTQLKSVKVELKFKKYIFEKPGSGKKLIQ